jgi:hypothetical protein
MLYLCKVKKLKIHKIHIRDMNTKRLKIGTLMVCICLSMAMFVSCNDDDDTTTYACGCTTPLVQKQVNVNGYTLKKMAYTTNKSNGSYEYNGYWCLYKDGVSNADEYLLCNSDLAQKAYDSILTAFPLAYDIKVNVLGNIRELRDTTYIPQNHFKELEVITLQVVGYEQHPEEGK